MSDEQLYRALAAFADTCDHSHMTADEERAFSAGWDARGDSTPTPAGWPTVEAWARSIVMEWYRSDVAQETGLVGAISEREQAELVRLITDSLAAAQARGRQLAEDQIIEKCETSSSQIGRQPGTGWRRHVCGSCDLDDSEYAEVTGFNKGLHYVAAALRARREGRSE